MSDSESCSETESLLRTHQGCVRCCKCRRLCLQSKSAILIIIWTALIGIVYTTVLACASAIIIDDNIRRMFDGVEPYAMNVVYFELAILVLLQPLIGLMADVSCGRFKIVMFSASLVLFSSMIAYIGVYISLIQAFYDTQAHVNTVIIVVFPHH